MIPESANSPSIVRLQNLVDRQTAPIKAINIRIESFFIIYLQLRRYAPTAYHECKNESKSIFFGNIGKTLERGCASPPNPELFGKLRREFKAAAATGRFSGPGM